MVHQTNAVGAVLHEGPEALLAAPQRVLRLLARGDVPQVRGEEPPAIELHGGDGQLDRELGAVGAPAHELHPFSDDGGLPGDEVAGQTAVVRFTQ